MSEYGALSDDFYVNMNLTTEMDLPQGRESILHFFDQVRRRYPEIENFYSRDKSEFVLEEEKRSGAYKWVSVEPKRINSGSVNPTTFDDAVKQHVQVLELVPFELYAHPLDCEALSMMVGFDYNYRGNHNEILAEAIGIAPGLERFQNVPYGKLLSVEPAIQFALDEECRTQCRVSFESRTTAYHVRSGEFGEEQISVYMTVRRYDSLGPNESYVDEFKRLSGLCRDLIDEYLVSNVLQPLQQAIAIK
ncbi:hypothetical protein [Planctomycetes bacterium K23_9]|uniref:TIGR04255 family protein n=1 Tax=Stieleria marina TaxID=1930275 RepID=A0A517NTW4_9BACT|nr:hypothetical protein K239x_25200 [Planctomycetes bacterium K23_9]